MGAFDGEHVVVVGAGVTGAAAARVLLARGRDGPRDAMSGRATRPAAADLARRGVEVLEGGHDPRISTARTLVVASPGVAAAAPRSSRRRASGGSPCGARSISAPARPARRTRGHRHERQDDHHGMLARMLRAAGLRRRRLRQHRAAVHRRAAREAHDALVVEVSSFQLAFADVVPPAGLGAAQPAPDHLDWHGSFDAYAAAKARVFALQGAGDVHVGNLDDEAAAADLALGAVRGAVVHDR